METVAEYGVAEFSSSLNSYDGCFFHACCTYSCRMQTKDLPLGFITHSFLKRCWLVGVVEFGSCVSALSTGNVISFVPS